MNINIKIECKSILYIMQEYIMYIPAFYCKGIRKVFFHSVHFLSQSWFQTG